MAGSRWRPASPGLRWLPRRALSRAPCGRTRSSARRTGQRGAMQGRGGPPPPSRRACGSLTSDPVAVAAAGAGRAGVNGVAGFAATARTASATTSPRWQWRAWPLASRALLSASRIRRLCVGVGARSMARIWRACRSGLTACPCASALVGVPDAATAGTRPPRPRGPGADAWEPDCRGDRGAGCCAGNGGSRGDRARARVSLRHPA